MYLLKEHYRELLNNLNFLKNERNIFIDAPKPPESVGTAPDQNNAPAKPLTAKDWKDHEDRYDRHIKVLPKQIKEPNEKEFKQKLEDLKKAYKATLDRPNQTEKTAAESVKQGVDNLINLIKERVKAAKDKATLAKLEEVDKQAAPAGPETDKQKPAITVDNLLKLEKADLQAIDEAMQTFVLNDYEGFIKSYGLDKDKTNKLLGLKDQMQGFVKEAKSAQLLLQNGEIDKYFQAAQQLDKKYKPTIEEFQKIRGEVKDGRRVIEASIAFAKGSKEYKGDKAKIDKLDTAMAKLNDNAKKPSTAAEATNEAGEILSPANQKKAVDSILKQLKIDNPKIREQVLNTVKGMKFSPAQIDQLNRNVDVELTDNQYNKIKEATTKGEKINEYDPKKGEMINRLLTNFKMNREKLGGPAAHAINDMFDTDAKPLRQYLAMKFPITEVNGKLRINNNPIDPLDPKGEPSKQLLQYLPGEAQGNFKRILNLKNEEPDEKKQEAILKGEAKDKKDRKPGLEEELWASGEKNVEQLKVVKKLQDEILSRLNPDSKDGKESLSGLGMILKLIQAIREAFSAKPPDWATLGDFMKDWNQTKNPKELAKRVEQSKDAYTKLLDVNNKNFQPTAKDLFNAYLNPRGPEADRMFFGNMNKAERENTPLAKYRNEAKPLLYNYITEKFGLKTLQNIRKIGGTGMEFTATQKEGNNKPFTMELDFSDSSAIKVKRTNHELKTNPTDNSKYYEVPENNTQPVVLKKEGGKDEVTLIADFIKGATPGAPAAGAEGKGAEKKTEKKYDKDKISKLPWQEQKKMVVKEIAKDSKLKDKPEYDAIKKAESEYKKGDKNSQTKINEARVAFLLTIDKTEAKKPPVKIAKRGTK